MQDVHEAMADESPITAALAPFECAGLTLTPTPIQRLARMSQEFGREIYVKRDDLTGFGLGGNKVRKLDYLLGSALRAKADTLITRNASSFSRNAAAAGAALGFEVHVVIPGEEGAQNPASRELFRMLGARLHFAAKEGLDQEYARVLAELKAGGRAVYELHPGGSDELGALSYAGAFQEIVRYSQATRTHFHWVIHATGSTGTQAGLVVGQRLSGYKTTVLGMAISQPAAVQRERVLALARRTAAMLGLALDEADIVVDDGYLGPGYPTPSLEGSKAVELFARREGILLDQVYGGKAAAGLLDYIAKGRIRPGENALFIHTGGNADLYY